MAKNLIKTDYLFTALAHMGNATSLLSIANNCVEEITEVPESLKEEMKQVNSVIHDLQIRLRGIRTVMLNE